MSTVGEEGPAMTPRCDPSRHQAAGGTWMLKGTNLSLYINICKNI
jgi:hypothetical protein